MIIMKFGGTSVEDAAAILAACERIRERRDRSPFVVVSACAGVTTSLLTAADHAAQGLLTAAEHTIISLLRRHRVIAEHLLHTQARGYHVP